MTSALVERAAAAALYWAQPSRRSADAIRGALKGLSDAERESVCDLLRGAVLRELSDAELVERMTELAAKSAGSILLEPMTPSGLSVAETGQFVGYAWRWGVVDRQGESIARGAFESSIARIAAGSHLPVILGHEWEDVSAVVGRVTSAVEDEVGLRVEGVFTADAAGQALRAKAVAGAPIGLSLAGPVLASRPGRGGTRELVKVDLSHVAVTNSPAAPGAGITAAKSDVGRVGVDIDAVVREMELLEGWAGGIEATEALASMVENPVAMAATAQLLVATETRDGLAELERWAATVRIPSQDEVRQESARVRRDVDNRVSRAVHETMRSPAPPGGCGRCQRCRIGSECSYA